VLVDQLNQDLISAMKAKDATVTGALRLLLSSVRNKKIELGHELADEEFLAVVAKEVKQRKDSIAQYAAASRQDLVDNEQAELAVLQRYLPAQLDAEAIAAEVEKAIASTGAAAAADMGKVMGALAHLKNQADMGHVSQLVRQKLAN
jgi:uncharacterized protein YqeY